MVIVYWLCSIFFFISSQWCWITVKRTWMDLVDFEYLIVIFFTDKLGSIWAFETARTVTP